MPTPGYNTRLGAHWGSRRQRRMIWAILAQLISFTLDIGELDGPNRLCVSDITLRRHCRSVLLHRLILDAWLRRIAGYAISLSIHVRLKARRAERRDRTAKAFAAMRSSLRSRLAARSKQAEQFGRSPKSRAIAVRNILEFVDRLGILGSSRPEESWKTSTTVDASNTTTQTRLDE